jgi:hypothetical protein
MVVRGGRRETRVEVRGTGRSVSLPVAIIAGSLALALLSLLVPSAPTYDPFAWVIWGREIAQFDLNTVGGPSWKPLPVVVTTITAPLGEASPQVWVGVARAGAIAAIVLTGLLAARLANLFASVVAAVLLGTLPRFLSDSVRGNSEGILIALVMGGVLCHLQGRKGWAFGLVIGAGLLRPEAWPFIGLYALFLLWERRARLKWLAGGLATLPVLWLAPEYWGSGDPFRAAERARDPRPDSPAFADHPALEVIKQAAELVPDPAIMFAVVALGLAGLLIARRGPDPAARRSAIAVLVLGALTIAWIALVAVMTARGFSGNPRYLMVPAALLILLGSVGAARAIDALAPWLPRAAAGRRRHARDAAIALGVALAAMFGARHIGQLSMSSVSSSYSGDLYRDLGHLVDDAGGAAHLRNCGHAFTNRFLVPAVAWRLHVHINDVDFRTRGAPGVIFHVRTAPDGRVDPPYSHARPNVLARRGHWTLTADCKARL